MHFYPPDPLDSSASIDKVQKANALWSLPDDAFVTPQDLATMLDCSVSLLAHLRSTGKGPGYRKRGKLVRYKMARIKAWLDAEEAA